VNSAALRYGIVLLGCASLVLALAAALECHSIAVSSASQAPWLPSAVYGAVLWCWWGLTAAVLWAIAETETADLFSPRAALAQTVIGPVIAVAHVFVLQLTVGHLVLWWPILRSAGYGSLEYITWNRFFFELLIYAFALALTGTAHLKLASQRDRLKAVTLEKQLSAARLRALQMQLEPHFLFNTLNAITSLMELGQSEKAVGTLGRLTAILRRTLRQGAPARVRLAEELALLDDYLAIEQTRFADRLHVDMTIDPTALGVVVPCFLMQPLVENAIRHGISHSEVGGTVHVKAENREGRLLLQVRDTGCGSVEPGSGGHPHSGQGSEGHGIGLMNVRERLSGLYGDRFELRAEALAAGGFEVSVELPFERETV